MSRATAQSLGRIVLIALVLVALLAILTTSRFASTRRSRPLSTQTAMNPVKGDVRRGEEGKLQYYDGRQWTGTPPPPQDQAF